MKKILFPFVILLALSSVTGCSSQKQAAKGETGGVAIDDAIYSEKDIFFKKKLFPELRKQNYAGAQQLIDKELERHPEYQREPLYFSASSILSFNKGKYEDARKYADKVIEIMEQRFAPKKPYQISLESSRAKDSVASHYLYRYQALMKLGRNEEALADVETALKISERPRILLIKASLLVLLKRYEDSVKALERAYKLDPDVLSKEDDDSCMNLCTILYDRGYVKTSACKSFFERIDEKKAEAEKEQKQEQEIQAEGQHFSAGAD